MDSSKGFLETNRNGSFRMTAAQKEAVRLGAQAFLTHHVDNGELDVDLAKVVRRIVNEACGGYPADKSCRTCDHLHGSTCTHWNAEVPDDAIDDGCEEWQDDGVPF